MPPDLIIKLVRFTLYFIYYSFVEQDKKLAKSVLHDLKDLESDYK